MDTGDVFVQAWVGNDIELDTFGRQFESYWWLSCGMTWDAVSKQSWY